MMKYTLALSASHIDLDLKKLKVGLSRGKNFQYDFVAPEERHIVLCALKDELVESDLWSGLSALELKLDGVWAYPHQQEARLLWVGVQNTIELRQFRSRVMTGLGYTVDEDFKPILPIVRLKNHRAVGDIISPFKNAHFGKHLFSELTVMEMISRGAFPSFRKVKSFYLETPPLLPDDSAGVFI